MSLLRLSANEPPVAAYQVSGEYSMIKAAGKAAGWTNLRPCWNPSLLAIKRAGADLILTYFAKDAARSLS
jgi:porphobilinogen synthase